MREHKPQTSTTETGGKASEAQANEAIPPAPASGIVDPEVVPNAVSVAQRFSSDLKLNLHWHLLLADGVWQDRDGHVQFYPAEPAGTIRVQQCWPAHLWCDPLHDAVLRITKALTRRGWRDRDDDPFAEQEPGLSALWRAALVGKPIDPATEQPKRAGLKKLPKPEGRNCSRYLGFSLHAGVYSCAPSVRQSGPGCTRGPLSAGEVPVSPFGVSPTGTGPTRRALRADAQDSLARRHAGRAADRAGADGPVGSVAPKACQPTLCPFRASQSSRQRRASRQPATELAGTPAV